MRYFRTGVWLIAVLLLSGCQSVAYYTQATVGQSALLWHSRPIDVVISDPKTSDSLRERLRFVEHVREYAQKALFLPATGSYRRFTDIGRDFVLWSVVAAGEFSTEPEVFCHPIAGCVAYQGYFKHTDALAFAEQLESQGYETTVGPVAAYSTLGWFADPVLSSVLHYPDAQLAELLFHELAHELLFVPGDTTFNESFATFVARAGVKQWLADSGRASELTEFTEDASRHDAAVNLIRDTRVRLTELYARSIPDSDKRRQKSLLLDELQAKYLAMRKAEAVSNWGRWFEEGLNNAKLASVGSYNDDVSFFAALFKQADRDLEAFYQLAEEYATRPDVSGD
ncbi:MAG TPA: aminopeptidase [Gammaproteobacteria bacterium]|jgi:predicted aminopeptidase|nr:aminopeptidase [Acidiferrobacteraceae bacterium]MDP6398974.1 aminopeptidase [Arenicellales bacterium]HCX87640.1 aminopeptidase [Gammaproteobacteria bacterium]MDP6550921.1 aminopeptidase [Arenicellales bacterium]MDP6790703.1 aminopeptidase [Arenicellales bacterium]|tara:strand:+ start:25787 stop:26806 length:1020 start_codon:yes stop_codon:yes gene_type:complete